MIIRVASVLLLLPALVLGAEIEIDFAQSAGTIRALHGINCGPLNDGHTIDLTAWHKQLEAPLTRLHDCHWPNPDVVDIHVVFPNFEADPTRHKSYHFTATDAYIQAILNAGSKVLYRLGESIEHTPWKKHVHPPKDVAKWAEVCVHIVKHYNEGWANGFQHNIMYWEIWNEPENRPQMWTGNDAQFLDLYASAAKRLKARFPGLKIGGPAFGHSGSFKNGKFEPTPFVKAFLERCKRESLPLDFLSWHIYTNDARKPAAQAVAMRELLDQYGFTRTESHLNEWNFLPDNDWTPMLKNGQGRPREKFYARIGGMEGALFSASCLLRLQDVPLDHANYYTGEVQGFGLFTHDGVPKKTFYVFKAFRELLNTPERVGVKTDAEVLAIAGVNAAKNAGAVLVAVPAGVKSVMLKFRNPPWETVTRYEVFCVDEQRELAACAQGEVAAGGSAGIDVAGPAVLWVRVKGGK